MSETPLVKHFESEKPSSPSAKERAVRPSADEADRVSPGEATAPKTHPDTVSLVNPFFAACKEGLVNAI